MFLFIALFYDFIFDFHVFKIFILFFVLFKIKINFVWTNLDNQDLVVVLIKLFIVYSEGQISKK